MRCEAIPFMCGDCEDRLEAPHLVGGGASGIDIGGLSKVEWVEAWRLGRRFDNGAGDVAVFGCLAVLDDRFRWVFTTCWCGWRAVFGFLPTSGARFWRWFAGICIGETGSGAVIVSAIDRTCLGRLFSLAISSCTTRSLGDFGLDRGSLGLFLGEQL